jgi:hypothetical protein
VGLYPSRIQFRGEGFPPEDVEKPRRDLIKLHLLKTDKKTYSLHQLIRQVFQKKLDESTETEEAKTAFAAMLQHQSQKIELS